MVAIRRKNLDAPDQLRQMQHYVGALVRIGSHAVGRGVLEPGWRWSTHMGPAMGTPSCPVHHVQIMLSGRFAVRMDDGEEMELVRNDVADIPPGHDAWVVGNEPAILIDFAGNIDAIGVPREHERIVTSILMTDIVDSTRTAERMGDLAWKQTLTDHNHIVRLNLARFDGTEVNTTGDGFLATFRSAVASLRCAAAIRDAIRQMGLEVRIGVHTGEIEVMANDIGGVSVHTAARIMALAGASEVLASSVTVSLADGSGLTFGKRGTHDVKGLERPVEVHALTG